jgi:hypothetical protein
MISYAQLAELSDQTSLPLVKIIRALSRSAGNSDVALEKLIEGEAANSDEPCPPGASRTYGA